ncbi:hypothetical protein [Algoriphagus algorifonticola]|uniref:hypothetical protein n=1 Tax=Algoriphagus algorifonticola TaxID=2593007 RepID=UPI0011A588CC|nr:hypothetical protein [Algoriphagus algorifonticola]
MEPYKRITKEIRSEVASIWFSSEGETLVLIIKAPLNSCKAIIHGVETEILVGVDRTKDVPIIHTGLRIFDDLENPLLLTGAHRFIEENECLKFILKNQNCSVVIYTELGFPLIYGLATLNETKCKEVLSEIENETNFYHGDFTDEVKRSLDSFDFSIDPTRKFRDAYQIEVFRIGCKFLSWNEVDAHFIGLNQHVNTRLTDLKEGEILEKHIWFSLETIFPFEIFLNPKFKSRSGEKEFVDIFAFYKLGIFLIESKSLSIFSGSSVKNMDRKVLSLQSHIKKAINQLVGASENINNGTDIFDSKGNLIVFKRDIVPHCIVLVAELFHFGDWKEIEDLILKTFLNKKVFLHVFDLRELMSLLKTTDGKKEMLDYRLIKRFEKFVEVQSIHLRSVPVFETSRKGRDKI